MAKSRARSSVLLRILGETYQLTPVPSTNAWEGFGGRLRLEPKGALYELSFSVAGRRFAGVGHTMGQAAQHFSSELEELRNLLWPLRAKASVPDELPSRRRVA